MSPRHAAVAASPRSYNDQNFMVIVLTRWTEAVPFIIFKVTVCYLIKAVKDMTTLCSEAHFPQKALKLCPQLGHLIQPLLLKASLLAPLPAQCNRESS